MQEREGGEPPNQEDYERAPPEQRAHQAHGMHEREWRGTPNQEDNEGAPPDQRAISVHGMQDREGEGTPDQEAEEGAPPQQRVLPAHGMQERGEVRGTPHQEGVGGGNPRAGEHALCARPNTGDGGHTPAPKTCRGPTPPDEAVRRGQDKRHDQDQELERAHLHH